MDIPEEPNSAKRTCIICGTHANSREHLFPASLGGQRVNKGIYCEAHNNGYARLAATISEQLSLFNSLLGVKNHHTSEATKHEFAEVGTGRTLVHRLGTLQQRQPEIVSETTKDGVTSSTIRFSSEEQVAEWIKSQQALGFQVEIDKLASDIYVPNTLHTSVTLGGNDEGLRSIGYIAQTFFAHFFPSVARRADMSNFYKFTLHGGNAGHVRWKFDERRSSSDTSLRHRISVGLDRAAAKAYATVELFSTLCFSVEFCSTEVEADSYFTVDIDPLGPPPPNDLTITKHSKTLYAPTTDTNLHDNFAAAVQSGLAQRQLSELLERIEGHDRRRTVNRILALLPMVSGFNSTPNSRAVEELHDLILSRAYSLMKHAIEGYCAQAAVGLPKTIGRIMTEIIKRDAAAASGLSESAELLVEAARLALTTEMIREHKEGTLTPTRLELLIGGGPGQAIAMKVVFDLLVRALEKMGTVPP